MSVSISRVPPGLMAALLMGAIASELKSNASAGDKPRREGSEDDGEIDIKSVRAMAIPADLLDVMPDFIKEFLKGAPPCDDPACTFCHPESAGTAAAEPAKPEGSAAANSAPLWTSTAQEAVQMRDGDGPKTRRIKELLAQAISELEMSDQPLQSDHSDAQQAITHLKAASMWAERASIS